jgi:trans-aconitate methyltransferase
VWSVKDVIAHFIAHEQRALDELDHALRGEPYHFDFGCNDTFNEGAVLACRKLSYEDVVAAWENSVAGVMAVVKQLTDADFDPAGVVVQRLEDSIDGAMANNTYEHWQDHGAQIEAWLQQL